MINQITVADAYTVDMAPHEIDHHHPDNLTMSVALWLARALIITKDTSIFGLLLAAVYALSLIIVTTTTKLAGLQLPNLSPSRCKLRERIHSIVPVILSAPFWVGVLLCSTDLETLAFIKMPFMEAIYWALMAWGICTSALVILGSLAALAMQKTSAREMEPTDFDLKVEEGLSITFEEALASTAPLGDGSVETGSRSPARPRMGSVTRCWSDANAHENQGFWTSSWNRIMRWRRAAR